MTRLDTLQPPTSAFSPQDPRLDRRCSNISFLYPYTGSVNNLIRAGTVRYAGRVHSVTVHGERHAMDRLPRKAGRNFKKTAPAC